MNIFIVCDNGVTRTHFRTAFSGLRKKQRIRILELNRKLEFFPTTESEKKIAHKLGEFAGSPRQLVKEIGESDILVVNYAPVTAEVMNAHKNLKLIGVTRSSPANVDVEAALERGIVVISASDTIVESVAEFTIGLLLAGTRRITLAYHALRSGREFKANRRLYPDADIGIGPQLVGKTLGIVGLGRIGQKVASKARALGMRIIFYDPHVSQMKAHAVGAEPVELNALLANADFITLHVRLTPRTRHMMGKNQLALMKKDAYLLNTSRGEVIDEKALYKTLKHRRIAGAALDVVEREPISLQNPMLRLDNVTITPHIAAVTGDTPQKSANTIALEIARFIRGEQLTGTVHQSFL